MEFFWARASTAAATSAKLERLRESERALIELAFAQKDSTTATSNDTSTTKVNPVPPIIEPFDTHIPASFFHNDNFISHTIGDISSNLDQKGELYKIHGISIISQNGHEKFNRCDKPLVLLHGYMNGGAYFYRNFLTLSQYFTKIYALDQLGWGLSSRPSFSKYFANAESMLSGKAKGKNLVCPRTTDSDGHTKISMMVRIAETFFVESLEAWRKAMDIDSMVLAGHSMGGLIAVAYAEKYPKRVHQLILISPVGVPEETPAVIEARASRTTWRFRLFEALFPFVSPGDILRSLPESIGKKWIQDYVVRRLPAITNNKEQEAVSEYLYCNNGLLSGSGEYCLPKLLKPSVFGRLPLIHRIPLLNVRSCSFLYGEADWMDSNGGLGVEAASIHRKLNNLSAPSVDVYQVRDAGHLLMLENSEEFNNGLIMISLLHDKNHSDEGHTVKAEQFDSDNDTDIILPKKLTRGDIEK